MYLQGCSFRIWWCHRNLTSSGFTWGAQSLPGWRKFLAPPSFFFFSLREPTHALTHRHDPSKGVPDCSRIHTNITPWTRTKGLYLVHWERHSLLRTPEASLTGCLHDGREFIDRLLVLEITCSKQTERERLWQLPWKRLSKCSEHTLCPPVRPHRHSKQIMLKMQLYQAVLLPLLVSIQRNLDSLPIIMFLQAIKMPVRWAQLRRNRSNHCDISSIKLSNSHSSISVAK